MVTALLMLLPCITTSVLDVGSDFAAGVKRHVSVWIDCRAVHFNLEALTRAAQAQLTHVVPSHPTPTPISTPTPTLSLLSSMAPTEDAGLVVLKLEEPRSACKAAGVVGKMQSKGSTLMAAMSRGVVYVMDTGQLLPRKLHLTGEPAFAFLAMMQISLCCLFCLKTCLARDLSGQIRVDKSQEKWQDHEMFPFWRFLNKHASFVELH